MNELANHLWQSTVFAAAIGIATAALRRNPARVRYWLWLGASLKFLIPFSLLVSFGTRNSGSAREGRLDIGPADVQDSVCIVVRAGALFQDTFVAIPLPFRDHSGADPPDEGMEPEERLHAHVQSGGKVVPMANVAELVGQDRFELLGCQIARNSFRQQKQWAQHAENARFH